MKSEVKWEGGGGGGGGGAMQAVKKIERGSPRVSFSGEYEE